MENIKDVRSEAIKYLTAIKEKTDFQNALIDENSRLDMENFILKEQIKELKAKLSIGNDINDNSKKQTKKDTVIKKIKFSPPIANIDSLDMSKRATFSMCACCGRVSARFKFDRVYNEKGSYTIHSECLDDVMAKFKVKAWRIGGDEQLGYRI